MTALLSTPTLPGTRSTRAHDRFNTVACLAIGAAILAYCIAEPALALAAFSIPILALGWYLARGGRPPVLPRLVVNVLVLVAIGRAFLLVLGSGDPVVSHLSEFLILIQLIKLFDRNSPRDEAQLLSLSLFIVIGSLLTSNTLGVGVLLLVYTPLATAAAMLLQIRAGLTRAQADDPNVPPTRATAVFAADLSRPGPRARAARRHFIGVVTSAVVLSFAVASVVFLLAPRGLGRDHFGRLGYTQPATSIGFTDQVRLGEKGNLGDDATPVMDVLVRDEQGQRLGSNLRSLHLRGAVLDTYDPAQRAWKPAGGRTVLDSTQIIQPGERQALATGVGDRVVHRLEVNLREGFAGSNPYLFSVWAPIAIEFPSRQTINRPGPDATLRHIGPTRGDRLRYTVWADLEGASRRRSIRRNSAPPPLEERAQAFHDGPVHDLAVRLLTEAKIPVDAAQRDAPQNRAAANLFLSHLRLNYGYTLDMVAPEANQDPIEMFLFGTKRGHCEYFASALVALCHAVGIDARLVTGYLATEFNPVTGQYLVRQSNAHAWAEVSYDRGASGRWQTLDPSPPAAIDAIHRARTGVVARLRQFYEAIDFAWNDSIVSFDDQRRSDLLGRFFSSNELGAVQASTRRFAERFRRLLPFRTPSSGVGPWLIFLGVALLFAALVVLAPKLLRRLLRGRRRRAAAAHADPQLRRLLAGAAFYDRALTLLDRAGLGKPDSRPPLAHADALAERNPELASIFRALATLYYRPRFARVPLSAPEADEARRLLERLAAAVNAPASTAGR